MSAIAGRRWHVEMPPSWTLWRGSDVVAAAPPRTRGALAAHVLVGHDRWPIDVPLDDVAARAASGLCDLRGDVTELGRARRAHGAVERLVTLVSLAPAGRRVEVVQVHALLGSRDPDDDGCRDVLQVVATCALDELETYSSAFSSVIERARFDQ